MAVETLSEGKGGALAPNGNKPPNTRRLASASHLPKTAEGRTLLSDVARVIPRSLIESPDALAYSPKRGIDKRRRPRAFHKSVQLTRNAAFASEPNRNQRGKEACGLDWEAAGGHQGTPVTN